MHWYWQDLGWDCYAPISQTFNRGIALDCQNFVSTQYLENELMEFHQVLHMHWYCQNLGCDYYIYASILQIYNRVNSHWFESEFSFRAISCEQIDRIWQKFAYALTRSRYGLLLVNIRKFITELWPLIDVRILFPLNILRANWWNLTKFVYALTLTRSKLRLLRVICRKFVIELWPLIDVRIPFLLNILRTTGLTLTKGQGSRSPIIGPVNSQKIQIVCKTYLWSF